MEKTNCSGFCRGPKNTKDGLVALKLDLEALKKPHYSTFIEKETQVGFLCPLGFSVSPQTLIKTKNVILNGGQLTICHRNPWKWG